MASGVRLLLRLPPAIRQQVLASELTWRHQFSRNAPKLHTPSCLHQTRSFSITSHYAFPNKQKVFKNAQPQKRVPQSTNLPKAAPKVGQSIDGSPAPLPDAMTPGVGPKPAAHTDYRDWISSRFPNTDRLLLYVAPDHTAFFIGCFMVGGFMLLGTYMYAQTFLKDEEGRPKKPWYLKAMGAVPVFFLAVFSTTFLIAPLKVIKSMTLVKSQGARTISQASMLRCEVKRLMPWAKPDVVEVPLDKVFFERSVPVSAEGINLTNHPITEHRAFTESYFSGQLEKKGGSAFSRFNKSLLNAWPGIKKNTRRMFLRDQIAYIRLEGNGNYKFDLQECHLLDGGRVLERIASEDSGARPSIGSWIKALVS